jgi:hypothetical protein
MKKSHLPEILACLVVLLALVLFALWWKRGSDRAACIINIRNVQQAVRGYSGMNNCQPTAEQMWKDIFTGPRRFLDTPKCPSGGTYTFHKPSNICAPPGFVFLTCSHAESLNHKPDHTADW